MSSNHTNISKNVFEEAKQRGMPDILANANTRSSALASYSPASRVWHDDTQNDIMDGILPSKAGLAVRLLGQYSLNRNVNCKNGSHSETR